MTVQRGTIKSVSVRGFAFITAGGQDVFVHSSDCEGGSRMFDVLSVGDVCEFEFVSPRPPKGPRARNVRYPKPEGGESNGQGQ
jgi:cold shock CspA family protein